MYETYSGQSNKPNTKKKKKNKKKMMYYAHMNSFC